MQYFIANGPMPTTVAPASVALVAATVKTLLQLKFFNVGKIVEWGVSFDGASAGVPGKVELLDTGTVFGTVTASVDADVMKMDSAEQAVASIAGLTLGTSATGYTCTVEGSITAVRLFDLQLIAPTNQYVKQFPLGREPKCVIGNAVRIRATMSANVNGYAYMVIDL